MDVYEHEIPTNFTLRHELRSKNSAFIVFLHFTLMVGNTN
jgi:hypothetical protein